VFRKRVLRAGLGLVFVLSHSPLGHGRSFRAALMAVTPLPEWWELETSNRSHNDAGVEGEKLGIPVTHTLQSVRLTRGAKRSRPLSSLTASSLGKQIGLRVPRFVA
jgi:hypothetical protein